MSTFDSSLVSAAHVLLKQRIFPNLSSSSELKRFRVIFGGGFSLMILLLIPLASEMPHPYSIGAFLIGPFAVVTGVLTGTLFGKRRIRGGFMTYAIAIAFSLWILFSINYFNNAAAGENPYLAAPLVSLGCGMYFAMTVASMISSRRFSDSDTDGQKQKESESNAN